MLQVHSDALEHGQRHEALQTFGLVVVMPIEGGSLRRTSRHGVYKIDCGTRARTTLGFQKKTQQLL